MQKNILTPNTFKVLFLAVACLHWAFQFLNLFCFGCSGACVLATSGDSGSDAAVPPGHGTTRYQKHRALTVVLVVLNGSRVLLRICPAGAQPSSTPSLLPAGPARRVQPCSARVDNAAGATGVKASSHRRARQRTAALVSSGTAPLVAEHQAAERSATRPLLQPSPLHWELLRTAAACPQSGLEPTAGSSRRRAPAAAPSLRTCLAGAQQQRRGQAGCSQAPGRRAPGPAVQTGPSTLPEKHHSFSLPCFRFLSYTTGSCPLHLPLSCGKIKID